MALECFDERLVFEKVKAEYARLLERKRSWVRAPVVDANEPSPSLNHLRFYRRHGKRLLDLVLAVPALLALAPILGLIALLVRFWLGSPIGSAPQSFSANSVLASSATLLFYINSAR
jgi:hypothetical protein